MKLRVCQREGDDLDLTSAQHSKILPVPPQTPPVDFGCSTSSITYDFGSPPVSNTSLSNALVCALME